MRRFFASISLFLIGVVLAHAEFTVVHCSLDTGDLKLPLPSGTEFTARVTMSIRKGFHIYSLSQPEGGPMPTRIVLQPNQPVMLARSIIAPLPEKKREESFGMDVEFYTGSVAFTLPLKSTAAIVAETKLLVEIDYQACSNDNCLLPVNVQLEAVIGKNGERVVGLQVDPISFH